jgi:hypothetical protein
MKWSEEETPDSPKPAGLSITHPDILKSEDHWPEFTFGLGWDFTLGSTEQEEKEELLLLSFGKQNVIMNFACWGSDIYYKIEEGPYTGLYGGDKGMLEWCILLQSDLFFFLFFFFCLFLVLALLGFELRTSCSNSWATPPAETKYFICWES